MTPTIEERVEMGIRANDKVYGLKWPFMIDLKTFDLANAYSCVLGQVEQAVKDHPDFKLSDENFWYTAYERGTARLRDQDAEEAKVIAEALEDFNPDDDDDLAILMGFNVSDEEQLDGEDVAYAALQALWEKRIQELREERKDLALV